MYFLCPGLQVYRLFLLYNVVPVVTSGLHTFESLFGSPELLASLPGWRMTVCTVSLLSTVGRWEDAEHLCKGGVALENITIR